MPTGSPITYDQGIGACEPGLPNNESLLYGQLAAREIETNVKRAIDYAADQGATLVLALLGHGFIPGTDPTLYLMGWDSVEGVRDKAVDVGKLFVEAADRQGIKGVIGIIDTCTAAGAQPRAAELATGTRSGQTRLSLLMASALDQPAYDMSLSRNLEELLRTGMAGVGPSLHLPEVTTKLRAIVDEQTLVSFAYDGDHSSEPLWIAHNLHVKNGVSSLGPYGTAELLAALEALYPGQGLPAGLDASALYELQRELRQLAPSPARIRLERVVDSLVVAQKTISFLRSFMAAELTSHRLRRALAKLGNSPGSPMTAVTDEPLVSEVDAVEYVALTCPPMTGGCRAQMARFVLELADDADGELDSAALRDWAASVGAIVGFNDALEAKREQRTERRLRLIVSLHYALTGEWPEALGAWLFYDNEFYDHEDFRCMAADQPGVECALAEAVDWAEGHAEKLGVTLRRIDVAVPTKLLLQWRPEEVEYGPRLGVNYDVLTHWSQRLDPRPGMRRINRNAVRRLKAIAAHTGRSPLHWLAADQVSEPGRLCEEFRAGRYTRAIGLLDNPGANDALFELLLQFTPILLWPAASSLSAEHCRRVDSSWNLLPAGFLAAYRSRWCAEDADMVADLRAVWDDEDWLEFCSNLQI